MKRSRSVYWYKFAFVVVSLGVGVRSEYASAAGPNAYVVDVQRIIAESKAGKVARKDLEVLISKEEERLKELQTEVVTLRKELDKQSAVLSGGALDQKLQAMKAKEREISRLYEDKRDEITRKNQAEIGKLVLRIDSLITSLAKKKSATFVVEADPRVVLYSSKSLDITDEVIAALDSGK
jgi:outer membrane protein